MLALFEVEDIAGGLVQDVSEAANDPQISNNEMIFSVEHSLGGEIKLPGNPVMTQNSREYRQYTAPPVLGQDTESVLTGLLGYSKEQVGRMKKEAEAHAEELEGHLRKTF